MARVHIVVIAALGALTFGWLLTGEHLFTITGITAFDWFLVNLMNRAADVKEDSTNRVIGVQLVARYGQVLRIACLVLLCVSFGLFHRYEPTLTLVRGCFHLLAIFYNFPLLPGRVRLKQIYIVKNVAAALGFVITCFAYPLAAAHWGFFGLPIGIDAMTLTIAGGSLFLLALSYELIADLSDVHGDAAAGIETFPVVLGPELSVTVINQLVGFSAIVLFVGYATHFVPLRILVLAAGPIVEFLIYRHAVKRGLRSSDPLLLAWAGAAMLACYNFWVWMRLPGTLL